MPPRHNVRSASRRSTPSSPPKARQSTQSPRQTRQSAREQNQEVTEPAQSRQKEEHLSTVQEDDDASDVINVAGDDATSPMSDDSSSSTYTDELASLDRDIIVDNLPAVNQDAESIISMLRWNSSFDDLKTSLQDSTSTISRRLNNFSRRLRGNLVPFGDRLLLRVDLLVRRLRELPDNPSEGPLSNGRWRPDAILHKANLALFLLHLFPDSDMLVKDEETRAILQYLADTDPFPLPFADPQDKQLTGKTSVAFFNIWTGILTQWFIMCVAAAPRSKASFDPDQMLRDTFWDHEDNLRLNLPGNKQHHDKMQSLLQERVNSIRRYFSTAPRKSINLKGLRAEYPWNEFLDSVAKWTTTHVSALNERIDAAGGLDAIQDALVTGDFTPQAEEGPEEKAQRSKRVSFGKRLDAMRKRDAERNAKQVAGATPSRSSNDARGQQARAVQEIPQSPEEALPGADDAEIVIGEADEEENPVPTQATSYVLDLVASQAQESNKENIPKDDVPRRRRLLDRQEGAVRLTWESDEEPRVSPPKRGREQPESEGDDDFVTDNRSPKRARTSTGREKADIHRKWPSTADNDNTVNDDEELPELSELTVRPPKIQRRRKLPFQEHQGGQPGPSTQPVSSPAKPSAQQHEHQSPSSTAPAAIPTRSLSATPAASAMSTNYDEVKVLARSNVAYARAAHPMSRTTPLSSTNAQILPISQTRRPWSPDEIETLIDSVEEYGCKWALILEQDALSDQPQLQGRNQVQLKDKARNIKLDFLKAKRPLPRNFVNVTISRGHKQMLAELGIPYVEGRFGDEYQAED